jgi:hypothetical protein
MKKVGMQIFIGLVSAYAFSLLNKQLGGLPGLK